LCGLAIDSEEELEPKTELRKSIGKGHGDAIPKRPELNGEGLGIEYGKLL